MVTGMPNKVIPFTSAISPEPEAIFVRERLILNVASLRYELDLIGILTPLPPASAPQPEQSAMPTDRKLPQPTPDVSAPPLSAPTKRKAAGPRTKQSRRRARTQGPSEAQENNDGE